MTLELYIVIFSESILEPFHLAVGLCDISGHYIFRYLTAETGRAHNQPLLMGGKSLLVSAGMVIESFGVSLRHYLYKILVAGDILGEHYKMPSLVGLVATVGKITLCDIHLASEYRLELHFLLKLCYLSLHLRAHSLALLVGGCILKPLACLLDLAFIFLLELVYIIGKLLDSEHIAMISQRKARHTKFHRLIDKPRHGSLTVKQ